MGEAGMIESSAPAPCLSSDTADDSTETPVPHGVERVSGRDFNDVACVSRATLA